MSHFLDEHWLGSGAMASVAPPSDTVYHQCLTETKTALETIDFPADHSGRVPDVYIRKISTDRGIGIDKPKTLPAILVVPQRDNIPPTGGMNQARDVTYGVYVITLGADNQEPSYLQNLDTYLIWRQAIIEKFDCRPQVMRDLGVATIINAIVTTASVVMQEAWASNIYAGALLLQFTSRELRGSN